MKRLYRNAWWALRPMNLETLVRQLVWPWNPNTRTENRGALQILDATGAVVLTLRDNTAPAHHRGLSVRRWLLPIIVGSSLVGYGLAHLLLWIVSA